MTRMKMKMMVSLSRVSVAVYKSKKGYKRSKERPHYCCILSKPVCCALSRMFECTGFSQDCTMMMLGEEEDAYG